MNNPSSNNEGYAPAWRPVEGEQLIGEIVNIDSFENDYGPYPIITIKQDDGVLMAVHGFHKTLRDSLVKLKPNVGDRITVDYVGTRPRKSDGKEYHLYKVIPANPKPVDWSSFGDSLFTDTEPDLPVDDSDLPEVPF